MAILVGHTGDLHLTEGARFADTCRALDWIAADGEARGVQLWLVGGDLVGVHEVPHVATVRERDFLDRWFQRLASTAPVIILYGNHDVRTDLVGYGRLDATHSIRVVTEPGAVSLQIDALNPDSSVVATVFCVPYQHKTDLLAGPSGTIREQNDNAADVLRAKLAEWEALPTAGPRIYFGHHNVRGAQLSGDEILANKEVELTSEDLDTFSADHCALSHIHLHQRVARRAYYAGSPTAQTFGESDEKGYLVVEVETGADPILHRRLTPARRLVTVIARWVQVAGAWQWLADPEADLAAVPDGAEVRLHIEVPEEAASSCPIDALQARFAEVAHRVTLDRKIVPRNRVRSESIQAAKSDVDRLIAWWDTLDDAPRGAARERLLALVPLLEADIAEGAPVGIRGAGSAIPEHGFILHALRFRGISAAFRDEVSIDFDALGPGIIALVGGNGEGKTHVLELSGPGTTHRHLPSYNESLASHLHPGVDAAFSELEFSIGGHRYRLRADVDATAEGGKGKTEAWLWRDGEAIAGEKVTTVDRALAEILPPLELLLASSFACQSRDGSLFTLSKADKKALFIRLLGLERLQRMSKVAGARAAELLTQLDVVRRDLTGAEAKAQRLDEIAQHISNGRIVIEHLEGARVVAQADRAVAAEQVSRAREALATAEAVAAAAADRKTRLATEIGTLAADLDVATQRVAGLEAALAEAPAVRVAAARVAEIDLKAKALADETDRVRAAIAPLDTEGAEITGRLSGLLAEYGRLKAEDTAAAGALGRVTVAGDVDTRAAEARITHQTIATNVAALEAAIPFFETAAEQEQKAATCRVALLARRQDLEPRTGLLAGIDVDHPMCAECPLTADARQVNATIATIDGELTALAPPSGAADALRAARQDLAAAQRRQTEAARTLAEADAAVAELRSARDLVERAPAIAASIESNVTAGKAARVRQKEIEVERGALHAQLDATTAQREELDKERVPLATRAARLVDVQTAEAQVADARAAKVRQTDRLAALQVEHDAIAPRDLTPERDAVIIAGASLTKLDDQLATIAQELGPLNDAQQRLVGEQQALGDAAGVLAGLQAREAELAGQSADWQ
ncbi:MAG: metallophosphoesterase, partial [bacterium]